MNLKKFTVLILVAPIFYSSVAQYQFRSDEGYSPNIGMIVYMLEDLKTRITDQVKDLDQYQTDFLFDENANSIGAMIMHLAATEVYYQVETLEGRSWTPEEEKIWAVAGGLGDDSRKQFKGKPIQYYLELWNQVRQETLKGLKTKDDAWLAEDIEEGINYHWVWYHVMEHQAAHMGQIDLVMNRLE